MGAGAKIFSDGPRIIRELVALERALEKVTPSTMRTATSTATIMIGKNDVGSLSAAAGSRETSGF